MTFMQHSTGWAYLSEIQRVLQLSESVQFQLNDLETVLVLLPPTIFGSLSDRIEIFFIMRLLDTVPLSGGIYSLAKCSINIRTLLQIQQKGRRSAVIVSTPHEFIVLLFAPFFLSGLTIVNVSRTAAHGFGGRHLYSPLSK